ncbi:grasp-with-spasm system ATP-grasp peptide maturase [Chryseobacterium sp. c4a]|uniref:grasp-with-spasm system ATP-grasp peptide maturase n=1 Tax=Chryseobacterium sp. c4a TaxID=1573582 RepID=UPI00135CCF33|nr:grasp-with-spasm system ATP-grasp peptide maturase [Chryseobacterium sp. c4a]
MASSIWGSLFLIMILILSTTHDDDTNVVMEHLANMGEICIRINDIDIFNGTTRIYYKISSPTSLTVENELIGSVDLSQVKVVWYRKWGNFNKYKDLLNENISNEMFQYLHSEYSGILKTILYFLNDKKWINHHSNISRLNKIEMLTIASNIGLKIPSTVIANNFYTGEKDWITKSINEGTVISHNQKNFPLMTVEYNNSIIFFFPSLFQQHIYKEYELRVFHLNGKNYPMAVFSQNDKQTSVDFRNYNQNKPNRFIPYQLPEDLNNKICQLMKTCHIDTGSIDIIKGIDGEYYFLEINPSGQFRMTSYHCNYNLHYELAKQLKRMNDE